MSIVRTLFGGYLSVWLIAMASMFLMVLMAFFISIFTSDATIIELMYFIYNGSISIFIVLLAAPIGFGMIVLIPLWNAVNDFIAPTIALFADPIFGGVSKIVGVPYTSFRVTGVNDQSAYAFTIAFGNLLKGFTDFIFYEVVR